MSRPAFPTVQSSAAPRRGARASIGLAVLALLALPVLGGCITRTLENGGLETAAAPADSSARGNMVVTAAARADGQRILRFANEGTAADRAALRRQADARMTATCGDAWHVSAEGSAAVDGVVTPSAGHAEDAPSPFWYVQFACVQNTPAGGKTQR